MKQHLTLLLLFQQGFYQSANVALTAAYTDKTHQIRHSNKYTRDEDRTERKLEWLIAGKSYKVIKNDAWYSWYGKDEIPENITEGGDWEDKIRPTDVCPGSNNRYTLENCPSPPDCSRVKEKWGEGKLCINRLPLPSNTDIFYIGAMKCIPKWENCDKCVCGEIDYKTGRCIYKSDHVPDDDRQQVNCLDVKKVTYKSYYDEVGGFEPFLPHETESPSNDPTAMPSKTLSASPSRFHSSSPSGTPSITPSITPTISNSPTESLNPSYSPTPLPTVSPSGLPTLRPSSHPSTRPTSQPSSYPSTHPTSQPSSHPSTHPTSQPSSLPSISPTSPPSSFPTSSPSSSPSDSPSIHPSIAPSISSPPTMKSSPTINISVSETSSVSRNALAGTTVALFGIALISGGYIYYRKRKAIAKDANLPTLPIVDEDFAC